MPTVQINAAAAQDLKAAWEYVGQRNPDAANKLVREITRKFALLRDHPQLGRTQNQLLVNLRSFAVKDYLIFYQPLESGVEILRVLHSRRDITRIFEDFFDAL